MTTSVLVTRPAGQAGPLLDALAAAGFGPLHHCPMLVLEPVEQLAPAQRQHLLDLELYQHIIFISANAVRYGMERIDDYWPQLPTGIHWYAIGETTAQLLRERGLTPLSPGQDMNSEGLLSLPQLQSVDGQRVLIIKGRGGRATLRQSLEQRGARVDELACYCRSRPRLPPDELPKLLRDEAIDVVLVSSGEGLGNMLTLLSAQETTKFSDIGLIVPSPRVAALARQAGFSNVVTAANASDAAMVQALQQWQAGD
ncbi:uroporphyrinogen-III synthase [Seongchinamella unica]|uniref:Uroporphyrinogen-III synthase n=1 Tax=Seongchinamella unica TaxID=2547392 RepID=A0A4V2ZXJ8_9GAMM|nr:uroporphyrinogen-III synthase [Seongchinamella unica]TDG15285.1 uroporphyrinogen-III synthase [Seongchinamella unica]